MKGENSEILQWIVNLDAFNHRKKLRISPWNAVLPEKILDTLGFNIRYQNLFAIHLVIELGKIPIPISDGEKYFIFMHPSKGFLEQISWSEEIALINFHKKKLPCGSSCDLFSK
jgi:hypothetical protein